jgi:hypothetical protein
MLRPGDLAELTPLVRRVAVLDPGTLVRVRIGPRSATAHVRLPFGVLVVRGVTGVFDADSEFLADSTFRADEFLSWLEPADPNGSASLPPVRDEQWRVGLPPTAGWTAVETVPEDVIRGLVRQGALTLKNAAAAEGVPGAQPRAEVADALLDLIVLTVRSADGVDSSARPPVQIALRQLSALVRMGFLARGSQLRIDTSGRWLRLVASYGSVYAERPRLGLAMNPQRGVGR